MSLLIQATDFTGKHEIVQQMNPKLTAYIEMYEKQYLRKLLGVTLYDLFAAQVTSYVVASGIYKNLYDAFQEDDGGSIVESEGMKEMLKGFIYFQYMRDLPFKSTESGIMINQHENTVLTPNDLPITTRYNQAVKTYEAIQWYIVQNSDDYPDYNGQCIKPIHWAL